MKRKSALPLGEVLRRFLREEGLETPLLEHRAVEAWWVISPEAVKKVTKEVSLSHGKLFVKITRSALRQELSMCRTQLAQRINEQAGGQVVSEVVVY